MIDAAEPAIMHMMWSCTGLGKSRYTQASINRQLELLSKRHGVHIGRRWLLQCERNLEDEGYIVRTRRYWRLPGGLIRSRPSLWKFTVKGMKWLVSKAVIGARGFLNKMFSDLKKKAGRHPTEQDFYAPLDNKKAIIDIQRLKQMSEDVTKDIN